MGVPRGRDLHRPPGDRERHVSPRRGDFDHDGDDDIVWHGPGGASDFIWEAVQTSAPYAFVGHTATVSGTYQPIAGDWDDDGGDDLFWYAAGAPADYTWEFTGSAPGNFAFTGRGTPAVNGNYVPMAGDLDDDADDDIVWYAPSGTDFSWESLGDFTFTGRVISIGGGYLPPFAGDFNGDDHADVFGYTPGPIIDPLLRGQGMTQFSPQNFTVSGELPALQR